MTTQESSNIELSQCWRSLQRRWLPALAIFLSILTLGTLATYLKAPIYTAAGKLRFKSNNVTATLTELGTKVGDLNTLEHQGNPLATESEVIRSIPLLTETLANLGWNLDPYVFREQISATPDADILVISYSDLSPEKAAAAVNTLMDVYLRNNLRSLQGETKAARLFLEQQLPKMEAAVQQAELDLRQFKQTNQVVNLAGKTSSAEAKVTDLQQQINTTQAAISNNQAQAKVVREKLGMSPEEAAALTALSQSQELKAIRQQRQQAEFDLQRQQETLTEAHPELARLRREVQDLRRQEQDQQTDLRGPQQSQGSNVSIGELQQNLAAELVSLEATRKGLESQVADLSETLAIAKQELNQLPQLEGNQRELTRNLETAQSTYTSLLQKAQELRIAEQQDFQNASILTKASVPTLPLASNQIFFLISGLLAMVAAALTVYCLELRDQSIKTVKEAENKYRLPVLGVIPTVGTPKLSWFNNGALQRDVPDLVVRDLPTAPISQAYRILQLNLRSQGVAKNNQVIVVTSAVPKEGKSMVAANLAAALAQAGSQVLLIDANFYQPLQDEIWELPRDLGLSNMLMGQVQAQLATKSVMASLDILTSGSLLAPAAGAFESKQMALLIESLKRHYDVVLIDAPALNTAADAAILGRLADATVLVVRPGVVDTKGAAVAKDLLNQSGQTVLGLVINGAIAANEPYNYFEDTPELEGANQRVKALEPQPPSPSGVRTTVPSAAINPVKPLLVQTVDIQMLEQMSLDELQLTVERLQTSWQQSERFVNEQEEELLLQRQTVKTLQQQLKNGHASNHRTPMAEFTEYEHLRLELQLADEQERLQLLEETLIGQRRGLRHQQEICRRHLEVLQRKRQQLTHQSLRNGNGKGINL